MTDMTEEEKAQFRADRVAEVTKIHPRLPEFLDALQKGVNTNGEEWDWKDFPVDVVMAKAMGEALRTVGVE